MGDMQQRFAEEWHRKIRGVVEELHRNPVFHMGLASKELFHSNFLGWLLGESPETAEIVLGKWLRPDKKQVKFLVQQEYEHLDLVVWVPGFAPVVIENKLFKTLPPNQLLGYNEKLQQPESELQGSTRIALTLLGPENGQEYLGWSCHRFDELVSPLKAVARQMNSGSFEQQLLERYIRVLGLLTEFRDLLDFQHENEVIDFWLDHPISLEPEKWNDYAKKVRYANVAFSLQQTLPASGEVTYRFDWSRTHPLVECFFLEDSGGHEIGWQLQDSNFKVAVRLATGGPKKRSYEKPGTPENRRKAREEFANGHFSFWFQPLPEFHDLTVMAESPIFKEKASGSGDGLFYGYAPDFVDRRANLPRLTFHDLAMLHGAYARHARFGAQG